MRTVAWFNSIAGAAGDMALGALVDAGADVAEVEAACRALPLSGWELSAERTLRGGIAGTKVHVTVDHDQQPHRQAAEILAMIEAAGLPSKAGEVFERLAVVEGRLHDRPAAAVAFHEVGAVDSIIDTVGTCVALDLLGVDDVAANAIVNGSGTIICAHGVLPNPPPAVVGLLHEGVPSIGLPIDEELTTPTGAALLVTLASEWGPMPAINVVTSGFGAGTRELADRPNLLQVVIGERTTAPVSGQRVMLLETNVDDASGELLAHAVQELLAAGAHDAWLSPIIMKKGRPGSVVSALVDPAQLEAVRSVMVSETGTFGVRAQEMQRWPEPREFETVQVDGHDVAIKRSAGRAKVEYEDAAAAARALGIPFREVERRALDLSG